MSISEIPLTGAYQANRSQLRGRRASRPPDVWRIHEALDKIGKELFGEQWCTVAATDLLPLFERGPQEFVSAIVRRKRRVKIVPAVPELEIVEAASQAASMFKAAYEELRQGIYEGKVVVFLIGPDGKRAELTNLDLLWLRFRRFFGAGIVRIGDERHLVWIERKSFRRWLKDRCPREYKRLTRKEAEAIAPILEEYSSRHEIKFNQRQLKVLINEARHPFVVRQAEITSELWAILPDNVIRVNGGAPNKEKFRMARQALREPLRTALGLTEKPRR